MPKHYDAIIVGARAAGAATAMLLARAGARVLVVEREAPGTDTLSTHALMRGAVVQLARWGILPRLVAAGTPPVRHSIFGYGADRVEVAVKPGSGVEHLVAPRRTLLDPALAAAAAEAGAELRYETTLRAVERDASGRVKGVRLTGPGGDATESAGLVVGADGRRSGLARLVGAEIYATGRHAAGTIYAHVSGLENRGYRWLYGSGVAAGAIPTDGGLHVVFAAMRPERYAALRRDLAEGLRTVLAEVDPDLAAEVAARGLASRPLGFVGAPGFFRRSHGPGWALVGDAGHFRDPITAHGITDALRDAEGLARAIQSGGGLAGYEETRDALSRTIFEVTDAIAALPTDLERLKDLHLAFAEAMKPEQAWLAGLDAAPARAA